MVCGHALLYIYSIRGSIVSVSQRLGLLGMRTCGEQGITICERWNKQRIGQGGIMKRYILDQDENQIADPCAGDFLDSHVHAARFEAVTLLGRTTPPHVEGGITQDASGVLWFESLRDMPSQRTEACFRFDANCKTVVGNIIKESG